MPFNYHLSLFLSLSVSFSLSLSLSLSLLLLVETQFVDYRFVKDLEIIKQPRCCCFCVGKELRIYADDKDAVRWVAMVVYICLNIHIAIRSSILNARLLVLYSVSLIKYRNYNALKRCTTIRVIHEYISKSPVYIMSIYAIDSGFLKHSVS